MAMRSEIVAAIEAVYESDETNMVDMNALPE